MDKLLNGLDDEQIKFICKECSVSADDIKSASESEAYSFYETMCDIEVEETIKAGDGELSDRGKFAEEIVTLIGDHLIVED